MATRALLLTTLISLAALLGSARAALLPGGGSPRSDCYLEFQVNGHELTARNVECTDGDPTCDLDGACDGTCRFSVAVCLNQHDPALPNCAPPTPPSGLLRANERGFDQIGLRFPALESSACGAFVSVDTPATRRRRVGTRIRTLAVSPGRPRRDPDQLRLICRKPVGGCPTTTSTTTTTTSSTSTTTVPQPQAALPASADTGIFSGSPDATLGNLDQVFVGNDATNSERALLRFDLTSIPAGATVTACTLTVDIVTLNQAGPGKLHRVKQPAWSETTATWNRYDGVSPWTTPGAFDADEALSDVVVTPGPDGPVAFAPPVRTGAFTFPDLTALCTDAIANRDHTLNLLIKQDADAPGATAELSISRRNDSNEAERPVLLVVYAL